MTKPSSRKAKGRRLQKQVAADLLAAFPELHPDDIKPAIMGESGEDVKLSPAARKLIPWSFECKNTERLQIWAALAQADANAGVDIEPVLVFSRNRGKTYAVVEWETFVGLIQAREEHPPESAPPSSQE